MGFFYYRFVGCKTRTMSCQPNNKDEKKCSQTKTCSKRNIYQQKLFLPKTKNKSVLKWEFKI